MNNKRVMFNDVDYTQEMEFYAHDQLAKLDELLKEEAESAKIKLVIKPDTLPNYNQVSLHLKSSTYTFDEEGRYTDDQFSSLVDELVARIAQQISQKEEEEAKKPPICKRITFRNMDHSTVMKEYADQQLSKIENFLENERTPIYIDLVFEPSKVREHHRIELRVKSPSYDKISNYEYQGEKFYDVLDRVIDVMYNELCEQKRQNKKDGRKVCGRREDFKKQR